MPLELSIGEALKTTKLFVDVAPDGWAAGERTGASVGPLSARNYEQTNEHQELARVETFRYDG